ncbi:sensor histidine kinase [Kiloniella antarctica]|uniref:histidine kinase n=1 Tax=Kiloniella antarctica TaxID=1550907 RepID=A0ABW5BKH8_9PROT
MKYLNLLFNNYFPEKVRLRILVFGFCCGLLATSFAAIGVGAIINRRAEIAEATWIGPVIARVYEELSHVPEERRIFATENFNRADAVQFKLVNKVNPADTSLIGSLGSSKVVTNASILWRTPKIILTVYGGKPRSRLLKTNHPPEDLTARLTFLVSAVARHDKSSKLFLTMPNGDELIVSSPKYWRDRYTEVQWLLILISGMIFSAFLYVLGTRKILRPFRFLAEGAVIGEEAFTQSSWPKEAREIAKRLNLEQEEKVEVIEERTRMLTAISHDLRTPATRLRLRAEFVEDEELKNKILADLDLMLAMTRDAIDFLKGGLEAEEEEYFEIVSLVQSICDDFSDVGMPVTFMPIQYPTLRTTGTVFSTQEKSVPLDSLTKGVMKGRPRALKRAITNLVANAIKYGFQAKVCLTIEPARALIEVIDRGPGIPDDEMGNVLKPFYRLEKSRNRETGGSGLGLSIVSSVIESHQGTFELINQPVQGLNATIYLPRSID